MKLSLRDKLLVANGVMWAPSRIRTLMFEMRSASQGAAEASDTGMSSSEETATSARGNVMLTQEQRRVSEILVASPNGTNNILRQAMQISQRSGAVSTKLAELRFELGRIVTAGNADAGVA